MEACHILHRSLHNSLPLPPSVPMRPTLFFCSHLQKKYNSVYISGRSYLWYATEMKNILSLYISPILSFWYLSQTSLTYSYSNSWWSAAFSDSDHQVFFLSGFIYLLLHMLFRRLLVFLPAYPLLHMLFHKQMMTVSPFSLSIQKDLKVPFMYPPFYSRGSFPLIAIVKKWFFKYKYALLYYIGTFL